MRLVIAVRFIAILLLLLLLPFAGAYTLSLKVTVSQGTLAPGTNITLVKEGVEFASAKADSTGGANFTLPSGSYFIYLDRGGYSRHVNLIDVSKDTNLTLVMRSLISYANVYGTISGPIDFSNTSVSAVAGGKVAKRTSADRNGYYLLQYLPEGTYEIRFESPGFSTKAMQVFIPQSQFLEENVGLAPESGSAASPQQLSLLVPSTVKLHSLIEVWLLDGDSPIAGKAITVETPGGEIKIQTGEDGKARVNAATPGKYTFIYGDAKASTTISGSIGASQGNATPGPSQSSGASLPQAGASPNESSSQPQSQSAPILALAGLGVAALALLIAILWAAAKLARGSKPHGREETDMEQGSSGADAQGAKPASPPAGKKAPAAKTHSRGKKR